MAVARYYGFEIDSVRNPISGSAAWFFGIILKFTFTPIFEIKIHEKISRFIPFLLKSYQSHCYRRKFSNRTPSRGRMSLKYCWLQYVYILRNSLDFFINKSIKNIRFILFGRIRSNKKISSKCWPKTHHNHIRLLRTRNFLIRFRPYSTYNRHF